MSKCPNCPIAGPCIAERPGLGFACKFAPGSDSERAWLANQSARMQGAPPPAYPPLVVQAGNLARAVGRFAASGLKTVDRAEFDRRRSICEACEHMDRDRGRCRKCGCALAVKPWGKAERCPEGKWEAAGETNP